MVSGRIISIARMAKAPISTYAPRRIAGVRIRPYNQKKRSEKTCGTGPDIVGQGRLRRRCFQPALRVPSALSASAAVAITLQGRVAKKAVSLSGWSTVRYWKRAKRSGHRSGRIERLAPLVRVVTIAPRGALL